MFLIKIQCKMRGYAWNSPKTKHLFHPVVYESREEANARLHLMGIFQRVEEYLGREAQHYKLSCAVEPVSKFIKRERKRHDKRLGPLL